MEVNKELKTAWEFVEKTGKSVFLTGKAGTGKTTFLRDVVENSRKRVVVVAPTGIAAINAGGATMHSFFQLPLHPWVPGMKFETKFAFSKEKRSIIKTLDLLIIDEISMVRADLLDAVDSALRRFRNRNKPFGGVQLLMIGDLQQLSPVLTDEDMQFLSQYYPTPYFFSSRALSQIDYVTIELKEVYRQQDESFISILNSVRCGYPTQEVMAALNKRFKPEFIPSPDEGYIRLTTHNRTADSYNEQQLACIDEEVHFFDATIEGNFPELSYPTDARLELKVGAQVMFVRNDPCSEKRYFNGKIGVVTDFYEEFIIVRCPDDDEPIAVEPIEWENCKYVINEQTQEIDTEVQGVFRQYPLRLAWAITIHKSQGLTFDKAIIDAAFAFASGQVYVALSRCRTLEGLVLASPLNQNAVISDHRVDDYIGGQEAATQQSVSRLEDIKQEYYKDLLGLLFDFGGLAALQKRMLGISTEFPSGTVVGLAQRHNDILNALNSKVVPVGTKWQLLIRQKAFEEVSSPEFSERIRKGCEYFLNELNDVYGEFLEKTKDIKAENKELVKRYNNVWSDLNTELTGLQLLLKAMSSIPFSTETYLREHQKAVYEASGFVPKALKTPKKAKTEKQPKEKKEDTKITTLKLYKQGLNIEKIAKERDYTRQTIVRHLAHYVANGMLSIDEFVSSKNIDIITEAINSVGTTHELAAIKEACPDKITYDEIHFVIASMEHNS